MNLVTINAVLSLFSLVTLPCHLRSESKSLMRSVVLSQKMFNIFKLGSDVK